VYIVHAIGDLFFTSLFWSNMIRMSSIYVFYSMGFLHSPANV